MNNKRYYVDSNETVYSIIIWHPIRYNEFMKVAIALALNFGDIISSKVGDSTVSLLIAAPLRSFA